VENEKYKGLLKVNSCGDARNVCETTEITSNVCCNWDVILLICQVVGLSVLLAIRISTGRVTVISDLHLNGSGISGTLENNLTAT
jgi:hypothetical protein